MATTIGRKITPNNISFGTTSAGVLFSEKTIHGVALPASKNIQRVTHEGTSTRAAKHHEISTVYFKTVQTSSLICQQDPSSEGTLSYTRRGAVNQSKSEKVQAYCPVSLGPAEGTYRVNSVVFAKNRSAGGNIRCKLSEIDTMTGNVLAIYPNSASVSGGSSALLTWRDVEASVSESVFTLSCGLLPKTGLVNISVSEEI